MLTKRQNLLETIRGGHPDRYVNQFEPFALVHGTPFGMRNGHPRPGEMNVVDAWGVTRSFAKGEPGAFPVHTPDKIVIKDIEHWQDYLRVPRVVYDAAEWEPFIAAAEAVDRSEQFLASVVAPGVFEQCHYLMGLENCLVALYDSPREMHELIDVLTQFELDRAAELCKYIRPEAIFHHDDWGTQDSTFMSPDMFREFYKPAYQKIYGFYKAHGVELVIHHSDSYAAPLVPDMIDMGIDIWQGVMSTNDIPTLIRRYGDRITFMGGIDNAKIDYAGWTEDAVASAVDRACEECGTRFFIPCNTHGLPLSIYPGVHDAATKAIDRASERYFG